MGAVHYKFYATLLDAFCWYKDSESDEAFQEFINKLNRVPYRSDAADRGIALNELVDGLASGTIYPAKKDGEYRYKGQEFACDVVDYLADYYRGGISQQYTEGILETKKGKVLLYGYVDEILPGEVHDIKGTGDYDYPSFLNHWQKVIYPFCLHQQGVYCPDFTYMITDYTAVYREDYRYEPDRDIPRLILICEELIDFVETHRNRILDRKIFGFEEPRKLDPVYATLVCDQFSAFNSKGTTTRKQYGKKGEQVEVLSDHGVVMIVSGAKGPFPVSRDQLEKVAHENKNSKNQN